MSERRRWLLVALGYAVVLLALFWRVLWRRQVCGWDCLDEYWPDLIYQSRALGDGALPLWNPYTLGGYPYYADPQAGALTPVNWICTLVSWVFGVGAYLIQLKVLLLSYAALVGMHALVWRWTRNHAAAAVAALLFAFGSPMLVHKNSALIWPLLLLPWALVAFDAFCARASLLRGVWLGLGLGVVAVSHPQGALYCALVIGPYGAYIMTRGVIARVRAREAAPLRDALVADLRRFAPGAACAAAIAGLWIATVYLPAWGTVEGSARAQRTLAWALSDPLPVSGLRELFVPAVDTSWMHDIYLGPLAVIVVAWFGIVRREGRLWLAVAVISVLLALGPATFLLPWLARHAPLFGLFRIAYRYKLITGFACGAGAGLGLAYLARTELSRREKYLLAGLAVAWLVSALAIARHAPTLPAVLTLAALGALIFDRAARRRWWQLALVLLTLVDLWRAGDLKLSIMQTRPDADRGGELLAKMPGVADTWRYYAPRYSGSGGMLPLPYHASNVHGAREIGGFEQPLVSQRMLDILGKATHAPIVLTHFNTKYFLTSGLMGSSRIANTPISVATDVASLARLYSRAELLAAPQILTRLTQVPPSAVTAALVEPADAPSQLPAEQFAPVDGTLVAFERSRVIVDIAAPAAGILVVNEAWSPQWRASIDGKETPLFRANYALRGVVVPAGVHRVVMWLDPGAYPDLLTATIALVIVSIGLGLYFDRRRRRNASSASPIGSPPAAPPAEHA